MKNISDWRPFLQYDDLLIQAANYLFMSSGTLPEHRLLWSVSFKPDRGWSSEHMEDWVQPR